MARDAMQLAAGYAHTIIDGPARGQDIAHSVVIASDLVVIPIEPGGPSLWAAAETIGAIQNGRAIKETLQAVFLVSRKHRNTVIGREAKDYAADQGIQILETEICSRIAFAEALTTGHTIFEWAQGSAAAKDIERLVKELLTYNEQKKHLPGRRSPASNQRLKKLPALKSPAVPLRRARPGAVSPMQTSL